MTVRIVNGQLYADTGRRVRGPAPPLNDTVRCTGCGGTRPEGVVDCPVCDVPRGHVHGKHSENEEGTDG